MTNYDPNNPYSGNSQPQNNGDFGHNYRGFEAFPNAEHHNRLGMQQEGRDYPSVGSRFLAFFIDLMVTLIIVSVLTPVVLPDFATVDKQSIGNQITIISMCIVVWYLYRVTMEVKLGKSLGRIATGSRIIKATGEPVDVVTSAKRNTFLPLAFALNLVPLVGIILDSVCLIVIGVSIARSPTGQSLTDKFANALVLRK